MKTDLIAAIEEYLQLIKTARCWTHRTALYRCNLSTTRVSDTTNRINCIIHPGDLLGCIFYTQNKEVS